MCQLMHTSVHMNVAKLCTYANIPSQSFCFTGLSKISMNSLQCTINTSMSTCMRDGLSEHLRLVSKVRSFLRCSVFVDVSQSYPIKITSLNAKNLP